MRNTQNTTNVVSLADFKKSKQSNEKLKQEFRNSLNNDKVKERYNIPEVSTEERLEKIKKSIERINSMMQQIENISR